MKKLSCVSLSWLIQQIWIHINVRYLGKALEWAADLFVSVFSIQINSNVFGPVCPYVCSLYWKFLWFLGPLIILSLQVSMAQRNRWFVYWFMHRCFSRVRMWISLWSNNPWKPSQTNIFIFLQSTSGIELHNSVLSECVRSTLETNAFAQQFACKQHNLWSINESLIVIRVYLCCIPLSQ